MKKHLLVLSKLAFLLFLAGMPGSVQAAGKKVLCTTFPLLQFTRNVIEGVEGLEVDLMIPARLGCPHNYTLTPGDMRKLAAADILVINGLGMEEFMGAPLNSANPGIMVIDSSRGIEALLEYTHGESGDPGEALEAGHGHEHGDEGARHSHEGINPHLFASPAMAVEICRRITEGLALACPEDAVAIRENGMKYSGLLERLAGEFSGLGARLLNNRIVTQHGAFDYLARDAGLEIVAVISAQGGDSLSAAGLISLVRTIRERKVGAVFTEPQYPGRIGATVAAEAGVPSGELDPVASGPADAPLDYYQIVMRENIQVLRELLGVRE